MTDATVTTHDPFGTTQGDVTHAGSADDHGRSPRAVLRAARPTWPLRRHDLGVLLSIYATLAVIGVGVGELLTHPLRDSAITRNDLRIERWFVRHRTPTWNTLTFIGSELADTVVKIGVTAVVAVTMLVVWKRWLEPLMVAAALVLEAAAFITITWIVGRPRPDVPRLETSPVGSSFPSGHVAAAVVYSSIVVVIFWHTRRRWIRGLAVAVATFVPIAAGLSRMYRGMHNLSDVLAGAVLGGVAVWATAAVLLRAERRRAASDDRRPTPSTVAASKEAAACG